MVCCLILALNLDKVNQIPSLIEPSNLEIGSSFLIVIRYSLVNLAILSEELLYSYMKDHFQL